MSRSDRRLAGLALTALAICACAGPALAADPERDSFEAGADATAEVPAAVDDARDELKKDLGTQGLLAVDDSTGAVRFLAQLDGFLDSTPNDDPAAAAREYLADQAEVFGVERPDMGALLVTGQESTEGMQSVEFMQTVEGVPIVDSSLEAHLDEDGRLLSITGGLVPDPTLVDSDPEVTHAEALDAAAEGVGAPDAAYEGSLVAYTAGDELRLAWRVLVNAASTGHYDTLVDAASGEVVRRTNLVKFAGSAQVFDNYPGDEFGGTAATRSLTPYLVSNPTRLIGPNAHAFVDTEDVVPGPGFNVFAPPSGQETGPSSGTDFIYPFDEEITSDYDCGAAFRCSWDPKTPLSWSADSDQAATQLFYYVNLFHDHLENAPGIGFTAPENFEGSGRVVAQAQDGADKQDVAGDTPGFPGAQHANNANMLTLPSGLRARGAHADVPLGSHARSGPRRGAGLPARPRWRRSVAGVPRVHARAHEPAGDRRAGLRGAERSAGRGDRRGHRRLVRPRLPRGRWVGALHAGRPDRPGRDAGELPGGRSDGPAHAGDRLPRGRERPLLSRCRRERRRDRVHLR